MFNFREIEKIYKLMKNLKEKAFNSYYEVSEGKLFVEFEVDEFKYLEKYLKDWMLFNTDIIISYAVEWTDDDICRYNLYLNRGDVI